MVFEQSLLLALRKKYDAIYPLIFQRSLEKARSLSELFDILDLCPTEYPLVWNERDRCWSVTKDLLQVAKFDLGMERK